MTQEKEKGTALVTGIVILIVIIGVIVFGVWYFAYMNEGVNKEWDEVQEYLDKGCTPLTADKFGIPSTFSCPVK